MKVTQLYIYPIKSLRGISVSTASLCAQGLALDRRYVLLQRGPDGHWRNMFVGYQPEMALFHCSLDAINNAFTVTYHKPTPPITHPDPELSTALEIPIEPDFSSLEKISVEMHTSSSYPAYRMPEYINSWFTSWLGYEVVLAYLGDGLGIRDNSTPASQHWIQQLLPVIPENTLKDVNFSDTAALLVVSEASLRDLHPRIGEDVILEKFRPNIVVDGDELSEWDEDFWGELLIGENEERVILTSNCARCVSINVDLEKGVMGEGESGKLLKKLMKDRRVDKGKKWEPIFGRYGFPMHEGDINVGDEVVVSKTNEERTVWNGIVPRLAHV
ncbi:hypothetical protein BGZ60DRAFT_436470 [Tricladium varicosporioides]|nr:hypothetical protein BGZ60DRAFT_436470 [Hymenoscyphus varicosporioides]